MCHLDQTLSASLGEQNNIQTILLPGSSIDVVSSPSSSTPLIPNELLDLRRSLKRVQRESKARQEETMKLKHQLIIMGQKMEKLVSLLRKRSSSTVIEMDDEFAGSSSTSLNHATIPESKFKNSSKSSQLSHILPHILPGNNQVLKHSN